MLLDIPTWAACMGWLEYREVEGLLIDHMKSAVDYKLTEGSRMSSVDVIVPCYRYGNYLRECVESVLNQPTSHLRILIIDDASPDNTAEVAAELMKEDHRVEFVRHSKNIGHIATYNEGIRWAKADYMLLLSADDLLAPAALQRAGAVLDAYPDVALTYGRCAEWHDCGPVPSFNAEPDSGCKLHTGLDFIRAVCTTFVNPVPTPCAVVRTSVQNIVGGYRPNLPHSGDLEMWLRFAANGAVANIGSIQAVRRVHGSNMSGEFCRDACIYYKQWKDTYDSFFSEYVGCIDVCRLRAEADRVLAERAFWTGVAQLCRGRRDSGGWLLRFAIELRPNLRFLPPLGRLVRTPGASRRAASALRLCK